jgi:hypothetical protein
MCLDEFSHPAFGRRTAAAGRVAGDRQETIAGTSIPLFSLAILRLVSSISNTPSQNKIPGVDYESEGRIRISSGASTLHVCCEAVVIFVVKSRFSRFVPLSVLRGAARYLIPPAAAVRWFRNRCSQASCSGPTAIARNRPRPGRRQRPALRNDGLLLADLSLDVRGIWLGAFQVSVGDIDGDFELPRIQFREEIVTRNLRGVVDMQF